MVIRRYHRPPIIPLMYPLTLSKTRSLDSDYDPMFGGCSIKLVLEIKALQNVQK